MAPPHHYAHIPAATTPDSFRPRQLQYLAAEIVIGPRPSRRPARKARARSATGGVTQGRATPRAGMDRRPNPSESLWRGTRARLRSNRRARDPARVSGPARGPDPGAGERDAV